MPTHTPPLATGLQSIDTTPEGHLAEFVTDLSDAHRPGVYCLRLSKPDADLRELWAEAFDAIHPEIDAMQDADRLFYVGAAKDVLARVHTHLDSPNQSGALMQVAPVHSVAKVWWYDDVEQAFNQEYNHAVEWGNRHADAYVSQR